MNELELQVSPVFVLLLDSVIDRGKRSSVDEDVADGGCGGNTAFCEK